MSLIPLSRNPDHALPADALDVRGWVVKTSLDREKVGKVDDLLVDERGRPRYLDVDLGLFNKHVLLPLGNAHADGADDVVWVDGLSKEQLESIPEYAHDVKALTPAYESRLEEDYRLAASGRVREEREAVAHGELSPGQDRLARLGDLEQFRVASEDADPRGWRVETGDGERIGEVDELIIDTVDMRAMYLDCDVAEEKLSLEPLDRHILIPIEHSRLDRSKKRVVVDGIFSADLSHYPVYGGLPLVGDVERRIEAVYDRAESRATERSAVVADADPSDPTNRFYRMRRRRASDAEAEALTETARPVRDIAPPDTDRIDAERLIARERAAQDASHETVLEPDQEVRIRVSGGDIIIEKRPVE
jgi:hypothetical protein